MRLSAPPSLERPTAAPPGAPGAPAALESHLWPLADAGWACWRTMGLRGAGFPAARVLRLAVSAHAARADAVLDAEAGLQTLAQELDALLAAPVTALSDADALGALHAIRRALERGRVAAVRSTAPQVTAIAARLRDALAARDAADAAYRAGQAAAEEALFVAVRDTLADDRFNRAILWQNRQAWHTGVRPLLAAALGERRNKDRRRREALVANYLQRYCVKNDTIGEFGPVGWASIVEDGPALGVAPGTELIAARSVHLEAWCIDTLAQRPKVVECLRPWLAPRLMPFQRLEGMALRLPGGGRLVLTSLQAELLALCDGRRSAAEIAARVIESGHPDIVDARDVYVALAALADARQLTWAPEFPLVGGAARAWRARIDAIPDPAAAKPARDNLDAMEAALARLRIAATSDSAGLDLALDALERTFVQLTGERPTRASGETYGARTLAYEDSRRDASVTLGPDAWRELEGPLALMLTSARWLCHEVARMYREAFRAIHVELAGRAGGTVEAVDFWLKADSLLNDPRSRLADRALPLFQRRWAQVLRLPAGAARIEYSVEELAPRVAAMFRAPGPGWKHARCHSPDVMLAADGPEAVARGEYCFVLGELHLANNNLNAAAFLDQHPEPDRMRRAIDADYATPRIVPLTPKAWANMTTRASVGYVPAHDHRLQIAAETQCCEGERRLPLSACVVEDTAAGLVFRTRDGEIVFDLLDAFGEFLSAATMNLFAPLPQMPFAPRIRIGRLVIARQSWRFTARTLVFAHESDPAQAYLAARGWMRAHGLPRFVFVRSRVESKPVYVDFDSPILVAALLKLIRSTAESDTATQDIVVSEMLPGHDAMWLADADGARYSSEFRLVAVDRACA